MLPQQAIAAQLGISRSAVAGHIMNLTRKGSIKGRGYVFSDAPFVSIIGGANIDIHGKSNKALRREDSNPGKVNTSAGGVARNIAENLARLGVDSRLVSAIGCDHHGQMLMKLCREAGVDMQYVQEIDSEATSTYLSLLDSSGDMHVAVSDMNIIDHLGVERLQLLKAALGQASLMVLDTNLTDDALAWLTQTFADKPIFVDAVSCSKAIRIRPYLQFVHTLKLSSIEAEALAGKEARTQTQLRNIANQLHSQGVDRVFITRGSQGVFYSDGDAQGIQKLQRGIRDVHNTGGAGDAFLAGLAYAWLEDWPLQESVSFALAAADVTLSHSATVSPALSLAAVNRTVEEAQRAG